MVSVDLHRIHNFQRNHDLVIHQYQFVLRDNSFQDYYEDESCAICFPDNTPDDEYFDHFLNWFTSTYSIHPYSYWVKQSIQRIRLTREDPNPHTIEFLYRIRFIEIPQDPRKLYAQLIVIFQRLRHQRKNCSISLNSVFNNLPQPVTNPEVPQRI